MLSNNRTTTVNMSIDEILKALEKLPIANKKIYYSAYLNIDDENKIIDLCKHMGAKEIVKQATASDIELSICDNILYKFDTPIIAVAGAGSFTQKFDGETLARITEAVQVQVGVFEQYNR